MIDSTASMHSSSRHSLAATGAATARATANNDPSIKDALLLGGALGTCGQGAAFDQGYCAGGFGGVGRCE